MNIIDKQTACEWCRKHGVALNNKGLPDIKGLSGVSEFSIPKDTGQRVALVKKQMGDLSIDSSCLVWLDNWSVWPSGQWQHLFDRFRLSYGCQDLLIEKPAHIIQKEEYDAAISIAIYSVLMLWDCYVITDTGYLLYYSHDEIGLIKA